MGLVGLYFLLYFRLYLYVHPVCSLSLWQGSQDEFV